MDVCSEDAIRSVKDKLAELYPDSREVFLVRDFRDMVSSILAFNAKRGARGFGRAAAETDAGYVTAWSDGGYTTNLPLDIFLDDDVLLC